MVRTAHTIVLGGGTAGAAIAGLLAAHTDLEVLLVEAGPDYGPLTQWPQELLNASRMPIGSHDWGFTDITSYPGRTVALNRARVLGGCSAINGCGVIWGHRSDYDLWAALGNPGWGADDILPILKRASQRLRSSQGSMEHISPYHRMFLQSASAIGIPTVKDMNDLEQGEGAGLALVNIVDGVRWNTALAYLEPVRSRKNLEILPDTLVDRILLNNSRAIGVEVIQKGRPITLHAERVVVCGGAYGSPAILQRSGIGDHKSLETLGIRVQHSLTGVGQNLQDHPEIDMVFSGNRALKEMMNEYQAQASSKAVGAFAKVQSGASDAVFDLHFYADQIRAGEDWIWNYGISGQVSRSRGYVHIPSSDPEAAPHIHHGYLSDPEGHDLKLLCNGYERLLELVSSNPLGQYLGDVQGEWSKIRTRSDLETTVQRLALHTWHPVGTCRMGPMQDPMSVVNPVGQVHGLDGLFVADASIMPVITKGNTNLPTLAIAEKIAETLVVG